MRRGRRTAASSSASSIPGYATAADAASAQLIDAIGRALGAPMRAPFLVKRGAVDARGRVAWIEGDVARLLVAADGKVLVDRKLNRGDPANWGYEGCWVEY